MKVFKTKTELRTFIGAHKTKGATIGLVPTMGFLHEGHLSLLQASVANNDVTVVSIFVNPIQFGPTEDLDCYPRDEERDLQLCREAGVSAVFLPTPAMIYPEGFSTEVEVTRLSALHCGASRPGHFCGVTTVVLKLFNLVQPDRAYFGTKDFQQCTIIKKMVNDLDLDINIELMPIVREPDGLALSSRNKYLNPEARQAALVLHQVIQQARKSFSQGAKSGPELLEQLKKIITNEPLARLDYISIIDPVSLEPTETITPATRLLIAVFIGETRLIDNDSLG